MNQLSSFIARARTWYAGLPAQRRTSLLVGATLSFALTAVLWGYAAYDPMVLLFDRPMDPRSTSEIMDKLDAQGVEYHFEPGSQRIKVPKSLQGQLKVDFQSEMMGAAGGMDLLDNAPIGTTQFMERRRWAMALQREIESQINGFDQVLASKVLLSIPEESLFAEDKVDPSASVYVELKTGAVLSADEGARVAAMVAAAVPRLAPDRVEILDSELRVLHAMKEGDAAFGMSAEMAELQRQYDAYFTGKIERLLERVVGPGKVAAEVHVELDHTERTVQQRELDGENAVVIAQRSREATSSGGSSGGVPGTQENQPELKAAAQSPGRSSNEADEVANVDVPDKQTHIASLPGGILGITASVVVDGTWDTPAAPAEGAAAAEGEGEEAAAAEPVYTARTAEELDEYARIVAAAIGVSEDSVTVINRPFARMELSADAGTAATPAVAWADYVPWAAVMVALLLTFLFVVRPAMKAMTDHAIDQIADEAAAAQAALAAGGPAGILEEPEIDHEAQEQAALAEWLESVAAGNNFVTRGEVTRLVKADIVHSVVTLQTWISRDV